MPIYQDETWKFERADDSCYKGISVEGGHLHFASVVWKMEDDDRSVRCEERALLIKHAPDLYRMLAEIEEELNALKDSIEYSRVSNLLIKRRLKKINELAETLKVEPG